MDLRFDNATKFYGPVIGINDITCCVGPGITALFGSNGAGKSTMLKLASGQLRPSLGEVRIGEHLAFSSEAKRNFGYSPDSNSFYERMTGREFVLTMTRLYGYPLAEARERTERAIEAVGMTDRATRRIAGCSHGMRQRIKLAQALVHDPSILLLDEPMTGIDPGGRREFKHLLANQAASGKTVFVSTHILSEVEDLADRVVIIARGRLIAEGSLAEVRSLIADEPLTIEIVAEPPRKLAALLVELESVRSVDLRNTRLIVRTTQPQEFFLHVAQIACDNDLEIQQLEVLDAGAEAVFGYLTGGGTGG